MVSQLFLDDTKVKNFITCFKGEFTCCSRSLLKFSRHTVQSQNLTCEMVASFPGSMHESLGMWLVRWFLEELVVN